jgi:hypothetical protein
MQQGRCDIFIGLFPIYKITISCRMYSCSSKSYPHEFGDSDAYLRLLSRRSSLHFLRTSPKHYSHGNTSHAVLKRTRKLRQMYYLGSMLHLSTDYASRLCPDFPFACRMSDEDFCQIFFGSPHKAWQEIEQRLVLESAKGANLHVFTVK